METINAGRDHIKVMSCLGHDSGAPPSMLAPVLCGFCPCASNKHTNKIGQAVILSVSDREMLQTRNHPMGTPACPDSSLNSSSQVGRHDMSL